MRNIPLFAAISVTIAAACSDEPEFVELEPPQSPQMSLTALPEQPANVPWPTVEWPRADLPATVDNRALHDIAETFFSAAEFERIGRTHALLAIHRGQIVFERYDDSNSCDQMAHSMSIAKMAASAFAGLMALDGALELDEPANLPHWRGESKDPRRAITPYHLLTMTSGLHWPDDRIFGNAFLEFAFGEGVDDLDGYVASFPLIRPPGTYFQYSDGSLSLIGELLRRHAGGDRQAVADYIERRLFRPLGMANSEAEFDRDGTWYGSSGMRWSPCDLGRMSLLFLRGGKWDGERILPENWVDRIRTPTGASLQPASNLRTEMGAGYGMAAFIYDLNFGADPLPVDSFGHFGFGGHVLRISPSRDLILILLGSQAAELEKHNERAEMLRAMEELFPLRSSPDE